MIISARELNVIINTSMFIGFIFGMGILSFIILIIAKVKKKFKKKRR